MESKLIIVLLVAISCHQLVNARFIPVGDIAEGSYNIESAKDGLLIGAVTPAGPYPDLGKVTSETHDANGNVTVEDSLVWNVWNDTRPSEPEQPRFLLRTIGINTYNNLNFDQPAGEDSFPVTHHFEFLSWAEDGIVGIKHIPFFFDDPSVLCLKNNGLHAEITFENCDESDEGQHWKFVPVGDGSNKK